VKAEQVEPAKQETHIMKSAINALLLIVLIIISLLLLTSTKAPYEVSADDSKVLRENYTYENESKFRTYSFIEEQLDDAESQKLEELREAKRRAEEEERRRLLQIKPQSAAYYENLIVQKCAQFGCNSSQVIRIMYCESTANPHATNGRYQGLFQHDSHAWPTRASIYGVPGSNVLSGDAQVHVTAQMFANGLSYLWECK
jgi:hypothetical protein